MSSDGAPRANVIGGEPFMQVKITDAADRAVCPREALRRAL